MKYFIVGLHSSGKQEVIDILKKHGIKCGNLFSNLDTPSEEIYNSLNYELYSNLDINDIFENNAYLFIQELSTNNLNFNTHKLYEGLSKYEFDQNDVFVLSPDQLISINPNSIKEDICFVWMDSNKINRSTRYHQERRSYNFLERDEIERRDIGTFVKTIYSFNNSPILYFNNEDPSRVATILYTIITHPDTLDMFIKNFN